MEHSGELRLFTMWKRTGNEMLPSVFQIKIFTIPSLENAFVSLLRNIRTLLSKRCHPQSVIRSQTDEQQNVRSYSIMLALLVDTSFHCEPVLVCRKYIQKLVKNQNTIMDIQRHKSIWLSFRFYRRMVPGPFQLQASQLPKYCY